MDGSLAWRAALVQLALVAGLFALLLALPLSRDFFRDYGAVVGPLSWLGCSLGTGRLLSLGSSSTLLTALASGVAAALVGVAGSHAAGLIVAVVVFGVVAGMRGRGGTRPEPAPVGAR